MKKQAICQKMLDNVQENKKRKGEVKLRKEFVDIEHAYRLKEEKQARRDLRKDDFATKVLLEESSSDDDEFGCAQKLNENGVGQLPSLKHPESTSEIKRILNSVIEGQYEARHYAMITELRVRKMLAREKINYPSKESFDRRK